MENKMYDYSMAASGYAQFNENDVLLLNNNVGQEFCMPQQNNNTPGGFCGGNMKVDVSGHSTSTSTSKQQATSSSAQKKKIQSKHSTTKLSVDPQSVAARQRRHRISKRFRILQTLVPGGTKMDTASMLDEAIQYVKFLKYQIWFHEMMGYALNGSNSPTNNCNSLSAASLAKWFLHLCRWKLIAMAALMPTHLQRLIVLVMFVGTGESIRSENVCLVVPLRIPIS